LAFPKDDLPELGSAGADGMDHHEAVDSGMLEVPFPGLRVAGGMGMEGADDGGVRPLGEALHPPHAFGGESIGMGADAFIVCEAQFQGAVLALENCPADFSIAVLLGESSLMFEAAAFMLGEPIIEIQPSIRDL
jgi:hypothetical protein